MRYTAKLTDKVGVGGTSLPARLDYPTWLLSGTLLTASNGALVFASQEYASDGLLATIPVLPMTVALARDVELTIEIDDALRIQRILKLEASKKKLIENQIAIALSRSPDLRLELSNTLVGIRKLEVLQDAHAVDSQTTLVKADVLEWESGGKSRSVAVRLNQLKDELITMLDIEFLLNRKSTGAATTKLIRS